VQPIPAGSLAAGAAPERAGDSTQGVAGTVDGGVGATGHESNLADATAHPATDEQSAAGQDLAEAQSTHSPNAGARSGTLTETTGGTASGADPAQSHTAAQDAARSVADGATESTLAAADAASTANHAGGVDGASSAGGTASGTSATGGQSGAQLAGEQPAPQPELIAGVVEAPGRQATRREEVIPQTLGGLLPLTLGIDGQGEFDFDKAVLRDDVRAQLDVVAERLKSAEYDRLEIVGHTDRIGAEDYNQYLSERRAWAVARYLVEHGVPASKIRVEGRGMHEPMTPADACADNLGREQLIACLQMDRRVVISASIRKVDVKVQ
jgi:OOP family OmpA-OmpF porin